MKSFFAFSFRLVLAVVPILFWAPEGKADDALQGQGQDNGGDHSALHHPEPESPSTESPHGEIAQHSDYDELVVIGSPLGKRRFDVIQGTSVLSQETLERALQSNLGQTLAEMPGISSTAFGPGAGRPIIRGLDGPRMRVIQNGMSTMDASTTSPDHQVVADPLAASRIEILRGAGTLAYGPSAIGGVINLDDGRIPQELPTEIVEGSLRGLYGSAANEKAAAGGITTKLGPFAFRGAGLFRDSSNLQIPGYATSSQLNEARGTPLGPYGVAENTSTSTKAGTLGGSWIGEDGLLGGAYGAFDSSYGVPSEPNVPITIDVSQKRGDVNGKIDRPFLIFDSADFKYAYGDYQHQELEAEPDGEVEVVTTFKDKGNEGRIDLIQKPWRDLHGAMGAQVISRDYVVTGEEAFVPPSETISWGLYAVEEYHLEPFTFEAGVRFERQTIQAKQVVAGAVVNAPYNRDWNTGSFSLGASWEFIENWLVGFSLSRTERAPTAEELLSSGPHLATAGFETGDPNLDKETGLTIEGTFRKRRGRWGFGANIYWTQFDDFIALLNYGYVEEDGTLDPNGDLMGRQYTPVNAQFFGGEITGSVEAIQTEHFTGVLDVGFDWVKATMDPPASFNPPGGAPATSPNSRLPRIPPARLKFGVEGRTERADLRFELWYVTPQNRTAAFELPTDGYLMLNLMFTAHPFPDRDNVTLIVQGRNLTNAEGRVASSFLKDLLPLPAREGRVGLKVTF